MKHIPRYARPYQPGFPWQWHYVRISEPVDEVYATRSDVYCRASFHGTPFHYKHGLAALDAYYMKRFPWRYWNRKSLRCVAKRVWNARVIYETE